MTSKELILIGGQIQTAEDNLALAVKHGLSVREEYCRQRIATLRARIDAARED